MVPLTACRLAEPSTGRSREPDSSIGGKPLTKRRAGKLVFVPNIRQGPPLEDAKAQFQKSGDLEGMGEAG